MRNGSQGGIARVLSYLQLSREGKADAADEPDRHRPTTTTTLDVRSPWADGRVGFFLCLEGDRHNHETAGGPHSAPLVL